MKKKLLLVAAMVAMIVCMLAISVSAANQHYSKFDAVFADGTTAPIYTAKIDRGSGIVYICQKAYLEPPVDSAGTYEELDWSTVRKLDFSNALLYFWDGNKGEYIEYTGGTNNSNNELRIATENWNNYATFASVEEVYTGRAMSLSGQVFRKWTGLKKITIGANMTNLGGNCLQDCTALTEVVFEDSTKPLTGNQHIFNGCTSLVTIELPDRITMLDDSLFAGCTSLKNVKLSANIQTIYVNYFSGCTALETVTLPAGITAIKSAAFMNCSSLKSIVIPAGVVTMGEKVFENCKLLESVTFESNNTLTSVGQRVFYDCNALTEVALPTTLTNLPWGLFYSCDMLESVTLPASITGEIGGSIFNACALLDDVVLPSGATGIGSGAFSGCKALTSLVIPSTVTSIGEKCFRECVELQSITMPPRLTSSIGTETFYSCSKLQSVTIPQGTTSIGNSAFYGCKLIGNVEIPSGVTSIGSSAFNSCAGFTSVHIPATVTSIGANCFDNCSNITSITFEENGQLQTVAAHAFEDTKIQEIIFPNTLIRIGQSTFNNCPNLEKVVFGASFVDFNNNNAGQPPFANDSTLKYVYLPDTFTTAGVRDKIFTWNDNNANEYNKKYINLTFFFTGTKEQAEEILTYAFSGGTNGAPINTYIGSAKLISAKDYKEQVANGTLVTGVSGAPARYFVYDYNKCEAFYNNVHKEDGVTAENPDTNPCVLTKCSVCNIENLYVGNESTHELDYIITYADYTKYGTKTAVCVHEGCQKEAEIVDDKLNPLFVFQGYSAKIGGSRLTVGYTINQAEITSYEENTGKTLKYGVVAYAPNPTGNDKDNTPILNDLTLKNPERTIYAEINSNEYAGFNFILNGFDASTYEINLIMCAFVYDGSSVYYLASEQSSEAPIVVFNSEAEE